MDDALTDQCTTADNHAGGGGANAGYGSTADADDSATTGPPGPIDRLAERLLEGFGSARAREIAGQERELAEVARDRLMSMRDRAAAIAPQQLTDGDDVSCVLARAAGLAALQREVDRAHRTGSALTVVYVAAIDIDIDAGDATSSDVARALLGGVRSYDLVIAVGTGAFVCALSAATISTVVARFAAIEQTLRVAITVGYAELAASDTLTTLIDSAATDAPTSDPPARRRYAP